MADEITFTGKTNWAKVYPRMKNKYDKMTLDFFPSEEDRKIIKSWKLRTPMKEADDPSKGETGFFYTFSRPVDKGDIIVRGTDGRGFDKPIGNGSTVQITLEKYGWDNEFGKGTGVRVVTVDIVDLVEYKKEDKQEAAPLPA